MKSILSHITTPAFTLTEVLLAISIVGIIAVLVLPMIVTKFQNEVLDTAYKREKQTIEDSIETLLINENVNDYKETILYTSELSPTSFANTSGAFLKKFFRISQDCGDSNKKCFGNTYFILANGQKNVYNPTYQGRCVTLKNSMSLCMTPQTPSKNIKILMDLNGKKGPNIYGKDLREFEIELPQKVAFNTETGEIKNDYTLIHFQDKCDTSGTYDVEKCCYDSDTFNYLKCCPSIKNSLCKISDLETPEISIKPSEDLSLITYSVAISCNSEQCDTSCLNESRTHKYYCCDYSCAISILPRKYATDNIIFSVNSTLPIDVSYSNYIWTGKWSKGVIGSKDIDNDCILKINGETIWKDIADSSTCFPSSKILNCTNGYGCE
jgi:prepilin-type N-terminal cleavage/methylation domain-containing protein